MILATLTVFTAVTLTTFICMKLWRQSKYWERRNIPYLPPLPLIGSIWDLIRLKQSIPDWTMNICKPFKNAPMFGIWVFTQPRLVIQDPELIKTIMIKDFHVFPNRGAYYAPEVDPLIAKGLMFLPHKKWKQVRNKLSPNFTALKAKRYFEVVNRKAKNFVNYLDELNDTKCNKAKSNTNNLKSEPKSETLKETSKTIRKTVEFQEVTKNYTIECISAIFFGLDIECFNEKPNLLKELGGKMFQFNFETATRQMLYFMIGESLIDFFNIHLFSKDITSNLKQYMKFSFEQRKKSGKRQDDFVDFLIDLYDDFDEDLILAQPITFFIAGFLTSSSVISLTLHELCCNLDIQRAARNDVENALKKCGFTYEALLQMKYLDAVISETMRKYPALSLITRVAEEDYQVPGSDVILSKGSKIIIPAMSIHYNPEYFPDPVKFDPQRYLGQNKDESEDISKSFGIGPRYCVGKQFGHLIVKVALVNLISCFEFEKCPETVYPIEFAKKTFFVESLHKSPMFYKRIHNQ